jgi:hypothetical protein|tara:strand:+ start:1787 stop:2377 length:591 start_codon:yes stop_codon:yes gene_type:complete
VKTVYILTNEAMPGIIKIGWTDNAVEQRMKELDKTGTPLPFTCFYAKRVDDPRFVESKLHEAFDEFRIRENREFFRMSADQAKAALEIASGEDVTPQGDVVETESDKAALDRERKRTRFNFAQIGIEPGEILEFKKDPSITAKVVENDQIEFRGNITSLSPAALIIVHEMGYKWTKIAGPQFWTYKGKTLYELNNQ